MGDMRRKKFSTLGILTNLFSHAKFLTHLMSPISMKCSNLGKNSRYSNRICETMSREPSITLFRGQGFLNSLRILKSSKFSIFSKYLKKVLVFNFKIKITNQKVQFYHGRTFQMKSQ